MMNEQYLTNIRKKEIVNKQSSLEKGITLIALVITIIIMLILAGVSITQILGDNGLIQKSSESTNIYKKEALKEEIQQEIVNVQMKAISEGKELTLETLAEEMPNDIDITTKIETDEITGIYKKYKYIINKDLGIVIGDIASDEEIILKPNAEITATQGDNGWYKSSVQIAVSSIDTKASQIKYEVTGADSQSATISATESTTITIEKEGISNLTIYALDENGNTSERLKKQIKIDTSKPSIETTQENTSENSYEKKINVKANDSTSKIVLMKYTVGIQNAGYFANNGTNITDSFTANTTDSLIRSSSRLSYDYTVYAKDEAGNEQIGTIKVENLLVKNVITMKNGLCAVNNYEVDQETGMLTLKSEGGTQYGPYWNVPAGTYEITYNGTNLPSTGYDSYSNSAGVNYPLTMIETTPTKVRYQITIPEHENICLEVRLISNQSTGDICINNIEIKEIK